MSNVGEPFWIWIKISKFKNEIKFRLCLVTISRKREIRHFHVVVVQKRQRNVQKKVWYTCELLFCQLPSAGEKNSFYCHYIFNLLGFEYSGISKEKSFFSIKSLRFQLFLYPCAFFMCVISSFNSLVIIYLFIFIFICPIATFLLNAVNFPGTTIPFSISFKGKFNKRHPRLSAFLRISTHPFGYNLK